MLMTLPLERRTEAVCRRAIEIDGENIRYVPRDMRTEKLCYTAVQSWDYALDYVPEELKTPSMCMAAVERYGPALLFVPEERRTEALCETAVKTMRGPCLPFPTGSNGTDVHGCGNEGRLGVGVRAQAMKPADVPAGPERPAGQTPRKPERPSIHSLCRRVSGRHKNTGRKGPIW